MSEANARWVSMDSLNDTRRLRLHLEDQETPYFITVAKRACHFTNGKPVGLYGAGLHASGCAGTLGAFDRIATAKARAIELALPRLAGEG